MSKTCTHPTFSPQSGWAGAPHCGILVVRHRPVHLQPPRCMRVSGSTNRRWEDQEWNIVCHSFQRHGAGLDSLQRKNAQLKHLLHIRKCETCSRQSNDNFACCQVQYDSILLLPISQTRVLKESEVFRRRVLVGRLIRIGTASSHAVLWARLETVPVICILFVVVISFFEGSEIKRGSCIRERQMLFRSPTLSLLPVYWTAGMTINNAWRERPWCAVSLLRFVHAIDGPISI